MSASRGIAWVTGAAGFFGSHAANRLVRDGWTVYGIGHQPAHPDGLARSRLAGWLPGTVNDENLSRLFAMSERPPALVFHSAGGASVGRSVDDPEADRIRTVDATLALIRVLTRAAPGAHLILPSSAAVYGDVSPSSVDEAQPRAPVSPYGMHKALCEELCEQAHADAGIPVSIVRFFSLYGSGLRKQLLWDLCCRLNRLEREVTLFGTGAESRDWMHVSDAAELVAALAKAPAGFRLLNGGTGLATTVRDVATMIIRMMDSRAPLSFNRRRRPGDPAHLVADIAALDAFGFRPRIRLTEGAAEYVSWYRNVESAGGPGALVTPVPA